MDINKLILSLIDKNVFLKYSSENGLQIFGASNLDSISLEIIKNNKQRIINYLIESSFLEDEMGLPCHFAESRKPGEKTDNAKIRELVQTKTPLVLYGSYNERMYASEVGGRCAYIPSSFPGAIIRRHTGTLWLLLHQFDGFLGKLFPCRLPCLNSVEDSLRPFFRQIEYDS